MFWRIILNLMLLSFWSFQNVVAETCDIDDINLHLFQQIENVKKSVEILNTRLDLVNNRHSLNIDSNISPPKSNVNPLKRAKPIFDIRYDTLPQQCQSTNVNVTSCAEASECHQFRSGIYNITDTRYSKRTFTVYCDNDNYDGDWLYILRRNDGTVNFNRTWNEYVHGFGNVDGEHWIGLENLYALTNFYGPQELNVYVANFEGITKFARYSNFAIGNAQEKYKLKSLGRYWGTAGDSLYDILGKEFDTFDANNIKNCASSCGGGFWFNNCSKANPTGIYSRGSTSDSSHHTIHWYTFGGYKYSHKTIIFMIRRQNPTKLE